MSARDELNEQKFDAMLKPALYEYMLKELEKQEKEIPDTKHEFSKSFERKMNRFMRKIDAEENHHKKAKVIAAAVLVTVVALGMLTMNVEAIRVPIQNFFMGDEYSALDFGGKKDTVEIPVEYVEYAPEYVVDGYELVFARGDEEKCYLQYENIDGLKYQIIIYVNGTRTAFDTENGEVSETRIGNYDVITMKKEGRTWINFSVKGLDYTIDGELEISEIEEILDSI